MFGKNAKDIHNVIDHITNSSEQVELQQLTNGLLREQVDTVYIVPLHGLQKSLAFNAS